ncbi:hypothetical protein, partial [Thiolapillus sp.]|uniref:hypothetical protein n=1 Tax=Thiolapillus sp. TaxID=2017437 RepID=UPI003AF85B5B
MHRIDADIAKLTIKNSAYFRLTSYWKYGLRSDSFHIGQGSDPANEAFNAGVLLHVGSATLGEGTSACVVDSLQTVLNFK